jgi:hypothetical protein
MTEALALLAGVVLCAVLVIVGLALDERFHD